MGRNIINEDDEQKYEEGERTTKPAVGCVAAVNSFTSMTRNLNNKHAERDRTRTSLAGHPPTSLLRAVMALARSSWLQLRLAWWPVGCNMATCNAERGT